LNYSHAAINQRLYIKRNAISSKSSADEPTNEQSTPTRVHRNDISFIQGLLNDDGWKILSSQGYNVEDVQSAIQLCLNFKVFDYHPLSPLEVRETERTLVFDKVRELLLSDEEIAFAFQFEEFQRRKQF